MLRPWFSSGVFQWDPPGATALQDKESGKCTGAKFQKAKFRQALWHLWVKEWENMDENMEHENHENMVYKMVGVAVFSSW